ncbi:tellurite resistance/C4-dicarboxylate transporter family protein [Allopusillimonas ginsengisoli]|uniref:tellurite resistance/C4-dicarboxylate transporter family protein n=1 Tax=Allopusillimonas ginsengisoli TaxID=453575 RepID=UPI00101FC6DE|nr:tellurite resistance/C4-dicarboxylate transporter family protein [Allopusillimonas ginsengisoli]TEA79462.1 C4-dicarboxylate ABC transporter [Allopusillimonas ginsengisoli]
MSAGHLRGLAELSPANFGMVMATGIVSLAAEYWRFAIISDTLFYLNNVLYGVLCVLTLWRLLTYPRLFFVDMFSHLQGPGFFTFVAATNVLGAQYVTMAGQYQVGVVLWVIGVVAWLLLAYAIFTVLTVKKEKPTLDKGINGAWLLAVVATQSIAVLSTLLAAHAGQVHRLELNFIALSMWLWGGMLYIWMMSLIFYRYTFFRLSPSDLTPPYWINMGAMAISTLAGTLLIQNAPQAPYLESLLPFLKGFTIFYWATATWWIPMLLVLGVWRHVCKRFPLKYDPLYWGAVFPLGMYTVCTYQMGLAMDFTFLHLIPPLFFAAAVLAWLATFFGLLGRVLAWFRGANMA